MSKRSYNNAGLTRVYAAGTFKAPRRASASLSSARATFVPRAGYSSVARTRGGPVIGEMKYFDTTKALTSIPSVAAWTGTEFDPATFDTLCVPVLGAGINQRIGKAIKVLKIKINGQIRTAKQATAVGTDTSLIRLAVVMDKQTNAAQAQGEQVFTATATADEAPLTFQNVDNFGRFNVLKDKTIVIGNPNFADAPVTDVNGLVRPFKISLKFKEPIGMRFNATNGGTVADIVDNSFHIYAVASNADLVPQISYLCRVCYKE